MCRRAENIGQMLADAERQGGRVAMRCTYTQKRVELSGSTAWKAAFMRGYRRGEIAAYLKPWRSVGEGPAQ